MKFGFVVKHRATWPVPVLCDALGVSRSGFYAWVRRAPSARARRHATLGPGVPTSFLTSDRTYGARRVWRDVLEAGHRVSQHQVEHLMRGQALRARPRRRGLPIDRGTRPSVAPAANVLDRQFTASAPNQKWVADFTFL